MILERGGAGDDKLNARKTPRYLIDGITHHGQQPLDFIWSAARQQRHNRPLRVDADLATEIVLGILRARQIDERVPDKLHRHPGFPVDLLLERKYHQHAIGQALDCRHPPPPPGPDLGADVIDDGNAERLDGSAEAEIEVRKVDEDERLRLFRSGGFHQTAHHAQRTWNDAEGLHQPGYAQTTVVGEQLPAAGDHALAPKTKDGYIWSAPANLHSECPGI